jgi:hypothetical protein
VPDFLILWYGDNRRLSQLLGKNGLYWRFARLYGLIPWYIIFFKKRVKKLESDLGNKKSTKINVEK